MIQKRKRSDPNSIIDCGDVCEMDLYDIRGNKTATAIFDKFDKEKVKKYKWCFSRRYVVSSPKIDGKQKSIALHQIIMGGIVKGYDIDHINQDSLDNRKCNLRYITHSANTLNTKRSGVWWDKNRKKWIVHFERKYIGQFDSYEDAIKIREKYKQEFIEKNTMPIAPFQ